MLNIYGEINDFKFYKLLDCKQEQECDPVLFGSFYIFSKDT